MTWFLLLLALAVLAVFAVFRLMSRPPRPRVRQAPPRLINHDHPEAKWEAAAVPRAKLLIRYREDDGSVAECTIQPKTIRGEKVGDKRVRPNVLNAHCDAPSGMRAFRFERIVSASDARTGEFVDDLYTYLGSAQPGGAPAPSYKREIAG